MQNKENTTENYEKELNRERERERERKRTNNIVRFSVENFSPELRRNLDSKKVVNKGEIN